MAFLEELYKEIILTHYKSPKNRGVLADATVSSGGHNPSCGDQVELFLKLDGDRVVEASFDGDGCAISQASASLLTEAVKGKTVEEALALAKKFRAMVVEGKAPDPELGDLAALSGVAQLPSRVKCATLAWNALEEALKGSK